MKSYKRSIDTVLNRDDSTLAFGKSFLNPINHITSAGGHFINFYYNPRLNLTEKEEFSLTDNNLYYKTTAYRPSVCRNVITFNKPISFKDANLNETKYTYSEIHGGLLTEIKATANEFHSQKFFHIYKIFTLSKWRRNLDERFRPYLDVCIGELLQNGSFASQGGYKTVGDEIVKTYSYGDGTGVDTLIARGVAITAAGVTLRTRYGHDKYGSAMWEQAANARSNSCPPY